MARELLIFRHGKSDWDGKAAGDFNRPLAKRGRKAVKRMGNWLREQDCLPDLILSSPARRAEQTALRLCRHARLPAEIISWRATIYEADVGVLLEALAETDAGNDRIMLVGHNPGCVDLVVYLTGQPLPGESQAPAFPTAALAQLAMPDEWSRLERGCARLLALIRPRELDDPVSE